MPLAQAAVAHAPSAVSPSVAVSDAAVIIFRHALKVWAREQGVAEGELSGLTNAVLEFAGAQIRESKRRGGPGA